MNTVLFLIVIGTALAITLLSVAKWADEHKTLPADAPDPDLPPFFVHGKVPFEEMTPETQAALQEAVRAAYRAVTEASEDRA